ncbi:MAG: dihydropteroate synthase [Treponema sp.]|nr:dihydropteroate synthase [Treponema sp.]
MITFPLISGRIQTPNKAFVMGIVNITSDSFYEQSRGGVERAFRLIEEGADILDLGAESTRPGFTEVPVQEEISRLIPVIREIRRKTDIPISIDTRKKPVFEACFNEGADILNDVSSFDFDSSMAEFCGKNNVPVILTHTYPHGRENDPAFVNRDLKTLVPELSEYFEKRIALAASFGLNPERVIVDPGIGFGKTFEENVELIRTCGKLCDGKYSVMMALSRKRVIGQLMGDMQADRLQRTIDADMDAVKNGAVFLRVHDVHAHIQALQNL